MDQIGVRDIVKRWGSFDALKHVDLDVKKGEFLSVLGPSGCGKSTLLRIIAGLDQPSSGEIVIAGRTVTRDPVWKRNIGFVFQNFALWPHLSAFRNVSMGLELRRTEKRELRDRVMGALRLVQLEALADRLPAQLSGGQQQRVALARAIVLQPEVLLLDEPLSALDKNLRQEMQIELKSLQQTLDLTTIFVTHDQEESLSLSDRVVVMSNGIVEQVGSPHAIYNTPASEFVARFVGEAFFFSGRMEELGPRKVLRLADGTAVHTDGDDRRGAGGDAVAFVRPEWIALERVDGNTDIRSPRGIVERLIFFGQSSDYLINLGGRQLRVKRRNEESALTPGDEVSLHCVARILPGRGGGT